MATPQTLALMESAWPAIDKVLRDGLKEPAGTRLADLVEVAERPGNLLEHVTLRWDSPSEPLDGRPLEDRPLVAAVGAIHQLRTGRELSRTDLEPGGPSGILLQDLGLWARQSRHLEHAWILSEIAAMEPTIDQLNYSQLDEMGSNWRLVAFGPDSGLKSACDEREIDYVLRGPQFRPPGIRALGYPIDSFAVARLEDFTPSFDIANNAITLMLTERIELLFNVNGEDAQPRAFNNISL